MTFWRFLLISVLFMSQFATAKEALNLDSNGVILKGYDAVSYFKPGGPAKGDPKIQTRFEDATYLFASESNKQEFLKDPKKFSPQFGAWCAYAVANEKTKVDVDPKSFVIQDGRLLLFYNGILADTRKKWLKEPDKSLVHADKFWAKINN